MYHWITILVSFYFSVFLGIAIQHVFCFGQESCLKSCKSPESCSWVVIDIDPTGYGGYGYHGNTKGWSFSDMFSILSAQVFGIRKKYWAIANIEPYQFWAVPNLVLFTLVFRFSPFLLSFLCPWVSYDPHGVATYCALSSHSYWTW